MSKKLKCLSLRVEDIIRRKTSPEGDRAFVLAESAKNPGLFVIEWLDGKLENIEPTIDEWEKIPKIIDIEWNDKVKLHELRHKITNLITLYGENSEINFDAGYNNIGVSITIKA